MAKKMIELGKVAPGQRFNLDGVEFVKLDEARHGKLSFVLTADTIDEDVPFEAEDTERKDHNNFVGSALEKWMQNWVQEHETIAKGMEWHSIDLTTMDGMADYGEPLTLCRALTIDEYRKYRYLIPLASRAYWLATGWTTLRSPYSNAYFACYINTVGTVNNCTVYCGGFVAPRPALYLQSEILVSVETDDEKSKGLGDYTELELLGELQRRVVA